MKTNFLTNVFKFLLTINVLMMFFSCSNDQLVDVLDENEVAAKGKPVKPPTFTVNRPNQYALNVVYFIPTDFVTNQSTENTTKSNISELLLYMQSWYEVQMEAQGYGFKTFGLLTDQNGDVNVMVVYGQESSAYYQNNKGQVRTEVADYLSQNPEFDKSEHTFILGDSGSNIGFFGVGRWAVATSPDYTLTDMPGKFFNGLQLKKCSKIRGMLHELGHAFNLVHNCRKASEDPYITLLGGDGFAYDDTPELIYLTKADCAILNTCQAFNRTDDGIDYYGATIQKELKSIFITKDASQSKIKISGSFTSDIEILQLYAGFDFLNVGQVHPNDNYDEILYETLPTKVNGTEYTFNLEIPYSDLFNGIETNKKDETEIEVKIVAQNGRKTKIFDGHFYTTDITTQIPNDDILYNFGVHQLSDRTGWAVTANSTSPSGGREIPYAFDSDLATFWHSYWPYSIATSGAHEININMGGIQSINGVYLLSERANSQQWRPKHIEVQTSTDGISYGTSADVTLNSLEEAKEVRVLFSNTLSVQYIKILVDDIFTDAISGENLLFSEIDVLQ